MTDSSERHFLEAVALIINLCEDESEPHKRAVNSSKQSGQVLREAFVARWRPAKHIEVRATPAERRSLLEVFKYLSISVLETVAKTCRLWLQTARDEELWTERFVTDFKVRRTENGRCYRTEYLSRYLSTCWYCDLPIPDLAMECPQISRLLCLKCALLPDCRVVPVKALAKQFCITPELLQYLHVPVFVTQRQPCTYAAMFVRKVRPYYERRRNELVQHLSRSVSKATVRQLKEFDFKKVFAWNASVGPIHMMALFIFCGKSEATECLPDSLKHFIDHCKLLS